MYIPRQRGSWVHGCGSIASQPEALLPRRIQPNPSTDYLLPAYNSAMVSSPTFYLSLALSFSFPPSRYLSVPPYCGRQAAYPQPTGGGGGGSRPAYILAAAATRAGGEGCEHWGLDTYFLLLRDGRPNHTQTYVVHETRATIHLLPPYPALAVPSCARTHWTCLAVGMYKHASLDVRAYLGCFPPSSHRSILRLRSRPSSTPAGCSRLRAMIDRGTAEANWIATRTGWGG